MLSGVAVAAATAMIAGLVAVVPAHAAPPGGLSIDSGKVLDLRFDGNLTDSVQGTAKTMQKGAAAYGTGLDGQAFNFNGSNAINLGTSAALQPADLTVSFWYNPNAAMTGEQVFAWSKVAYNSDGWYLTAENANTPLALSIGPSTGQPYKVAVEGSRDAFFPAGQWTHVVVTYDKATKNVAFYRNGVRQISTIKYQATGAATGVLGSESTSVKTLGYNGPQYNGAHANGLMDDYALYNGVATIDDVISLTQSNNPAFNPSSVAQSALDALSVPGTATVDFALTTQTIGGVQVSWASSDPAVIAVAGANATVTRPTGSAATVTLTATGTYGSSTPVTKTFEVSVPPAGASTSIYLESTNLSEVLLEDPYLVNSNDKMVAYLLSLDPEKFLRGFYDQAGIASTTPAYGGWERLSGTRFSGHFFGHYISALSQAYATETDATIKAQLLAKLTTAVEGLDAAQTAYAANNPSNAGYVSPFSISVLPSGGGGLLVPFYNLHKVLAGLIDAYTYAPEDVSQDALKVASGFGTWVKNWAGAQSNPASILNTEYGGMNEALYNLYSITENPDHKRAAEYFDETTLFQQLANGTDVLNGKHANTTIPKLVGALKRYEVFTDNPHLYATLTTAEKANLEMYRTAAENFWQIVINDHTYVNGGNSQSEHFHGANTLYARATTGATTGYGENSTVEGCNEYNMLKLTKALFRVNPDVKYADYYEHTYINTILASQNPETGMMTYFQPMTAGYAKVFGRPEDEFWCDHGTATESFTKLGDSIYFRKGNSVYVNMFRSSVLTSEAQNLKLTQEADVPNEETVTYSVEALDGTTLPDGTTLRLRIPSWVAGTPTLTVNGVSQDVAALTVAGYIVLEVEDGDELVYTLPAEVAVDDNTENPNWVAFTYGPVVLATELSRTNVEASYTAGVLVRMSQADKSLNNNVVVNDTTAAWKANISANLERISNGQNLNGMETMRFKLHGVDPAAAQLTFQPYYSLYNARYALYMNLVQPDSAEAQALILKGKQQLRTDETTIDSLISFDNNNSEADKNYKFNNSTVGVFQGQSFRHAPAAAGSWFQYEMIVDPSLPTNYLGVRYYGGDNGRTFGVYLNDVLLKTEVVTNAQGATSFYIQYDAIPQAIIDGIAAKDSYKRDQNGNYVLDDEGQKIPVVTVRFQSTGSTTVGGVFGVYTRSQTTYSAAAELSGLTFEGGTLAPALTPGVHDYTVTVPEGATSASFDADPATPSGLVYHGDVLIDDTLPRTVALAAGEAPTVLTLRSVAQDHQTSVTYRIEIVRGTATPAPEIDVSAVVATRCVAGKLVVAPSVTNGSEFPVDVTVTSPYGSKTIAALAEGKTASAAFSTRQATIPSGGLITVTASATVEGESVTSEVTAPIPAATCS